jgi:hypothetical protein
MQAATTAAIAFILAAVASMTSPAAGQESETLSIASHDLTDERSWRETQATRRPSR